MTPSPETSTATDALQKARELIATIEHDQWVHWSKAVAHEVSSERKKRWEQYWIPYEELDEETKEHDRVWADKVIFAIHAELERVTAERDVALKGYMEHSEKPSAPRTMTGVSFTVCVGSYGGFYAKCSTMACRLCLGWIAFTLYFCDLEAFIQYIRARK